MQPGTSLSRLVEIMDRLLGPGGCPWDREQTLETLRPFLVEETYEVLDALSRDDAADHCEELGDLLMQIVFQAALRREQGAFDIDAVIAGISDKLVRRHPHVFGDAAGVDTPDKVLAQWDQIKAAEKADKGGDKPKRTLDGIPPGPALVRAQKIGHRCGKVGFDWPGWEGSFAKVEEEVAEVLAAVRALRKKVGDGAAGRWLRDHADALMRLDVSMVKAEGALEKHTDNQARMVERLEREQRRYDEWQRHTRRLRGDED